MNDEKRWSKGLLIALLPGIVFIIFLFIYPFIYGLFLSLTPLEPPAKIEYNKFQNEILNKVNDEKDKDYLLACYVPDRNKKYYVLTDKVYNDLVKLDSEPKKKLLDIFDTAGFSIPLRFSLNNFIGFFTDTWESKTVGITMTIALPVTILNVVLALPFAYYMRRGVRGEKIITFFLIVPITLGVVLISEGMLSYMGPNGWLNQILITTGLLSKPYRFTHSMTGVIISLVIQGFPYAFLMLLGYISGINPDLEKASQMLGANKFQTFMKILFPLTVPGIAIAFCLNFVMAFSTFPSAVLLGEPSGPTRVISIAAYQWAFEKFNFSMGSAISLTMAVIELLIIMIVLLWRQRIYRGASIVGKG